MQASRTGLDERGRACLKEGCEDLSPESENLLQRSPVAGYAVLGGGRMAQGREIEGVARVALGDDPSSDGAGRFSMCPHQPFHVDAVWLYRAELQPSRVQSPSLFEAAQLRIPGPLEGGDCLPVGGQRQVFIGKCRGVRAPTW
jgi:hypothetical protein